jgi:hypothetical protein
MRSSACSRGKGSSSHGSRVVSPGGSAPECSRTLLPEPEMAQDALDDIGRHQPWKMKLLRQGRTSTPRSFNNKQRFKNSSADGNPQRTDRPATRKRCRHFIALNRIFERLDRLQPLIHQPDALGGAPVDPWFCRGDPVISLVALQKLALAVRFPQSLVAHH